MEQIRALIYETEITLSLNRARVAEPPFDFNGLSCTSFLLLCAKANLSYTIYLVFSFVYPLFNPTVLSAFPPSINYCFLPLTAISIVVFIFVLYTGNRVPTSLNMWPSSLVTCDHVIFVSYDQSVSLVTSGLLQH